MQTLKSRRAFGFVLVGGVLVSCALGCGQSKPKAEMPPRDYAQEIKKVQDSPDISAADKARAIDTLKKMEAAQSK